MGTRYGVLAVTRQLLEVCELPDGTLTLDDHAATAAKQRAEDQKFEEEEFNRNLARARAATPDRVDRLWACLDQKLISHKAAFDLVRTGRITDQGWEAIQGLGSRSRVAPDLETKFRKISCWTAEFKAPAGAREVAFDPLGNRAGPFPWMAVTGVLNELGDDGWQVVHISEDRGVDDGADVSFLVAARFVLAR